MTRLLLVEDDANLCYIIRGGLEDMIGGYEIQTAADGEEGLRIWKTWKPDVIVSDIEMPVMDGYEMVRRIRETDERTPILFTSGRVSPKDVVKGYELGVNNYIKKPFLPEELHAPRHRPAQADAGQAGGSPRDALPDRQALHVQCRLLYLIKGGRGSGNPHCARGGPAPPAVREQG